MPFKKKPIVAKRSKISKVKAFEIQEYFYKDDLQPDRIEISFNRSYKLFEIAVCHNGRKEEYSIPLGKEIFNNIGFFLNITNWFNVMNILRGFFLGDVYKEFIGVKDGNKDVE